MTIVIRRVKPTNARNALFCFTATLLAAIANSPIKDLMGARIHKEVKTFTQSKKHIHYHRLSKILPVKSYYKTHFNDALDTTSDFTIVFNRSDYGNTLYTLDNDNEKRSARLTDSTYLTEANDLETQRLAQISIRRCEILVHLKQLTTEEQFITQFLDNPPDLRSPDLDCNCNKAFIAEHTEINTINQFQNGICNVAVTIVTGKENRSDILQNGNYHKAQIKQVGTEQDLIQLQLGALNHAEDWQEGNTNRIHVIQSGEINYHFATQYGAGNELRIIQSK